MICKQSKCKYPETCSHNNDCMEDLVVKANLNRRSMIKTNSNYWDCECESNYIHKKAETNHCVKCDTHEDDQPDSRQEEIDAIQN